MSIEPARASHAQPPPACFEWLEALELWREFRRTGASSQAVEPMDKGTAWPHALPPLFVAAIQWPDKTPAMKARRAAFASFCETLPTVPVEWHAPPMYAVGRGSQWNDFAGRWSDEPTYRRPPNPAPAQPSTVEIDAITAPQAKQIFTDRGEVPDRLLRAWIAHHCPENTIEPAHPAPAAPPEAVLMPAQAPHRRQRRDLITPAIEKAVSACDGRTDPAEVFSVLRQWATEKPPRPPLMGVTEKGIQWLSANDDAKELTPGALAKRLKPPAKRG